MKMEMSYLLMAFASVLAPMARGQSTPPQPKITGVLTILSPKPGVTVEQVMKIMPAEIRATTRERFRAPEVFTEKSVGLPISSSIRKYRR